MIYATSIRKLCGIVAIGVVSSNLAAAEETVETQKTELVKMLTRRIDWIQNGFLAQCPQYKNASILPASKTPRLRVSPADAAPVGMAGIFFSPGFDKIASAVKAIPRVLAIGTAVTATAAVSGYVGKSITDKWGPGNLEDFAKQLQQDVTWSHSNDGWVRSVTGSKIDFEAARKDVDQLTRTYSELIRHLHSKELQELEADSGLFGGRVDFLRKRKDLAPELYHALRCVVMLQTQMLLIARLSDLKSPAADSKPEKNNTESPELAPRNEDFHDRQT